MKHRGLRRWEKKTRATRVRRWLCFSGKGDTGFHGKLTDTPKYCRHVGCKNRRTLEGPPIRERRRLQEEED